MNTAIKEENKAKNRVIDAYLSFLETNRRTPTSSDLNRDYGISIKAIRFHFGNMGNLHSYINENCAEYFIDLIEEEKPKDTSLIENSYLDLVSKNKRLPNSTDMLGMGVTLTSIRYYFGNMTNLHEHMEGAYGEEISKSVLSANVVFDERRMSLLSKDLEKYKRFVVTTVVNGKSIHEPFYNTIKSYCEINDVKLILIACQDVANRSTNYEYSFPAILNNEHFISKDTRINDNLFISSIKLSAKQIKPTTGLGRIGQRNGSYIFASPKQFLEYIGNGMDGDKMPSAMMTTGAITKNDYNNERYMSDRTSYIAETDHIYGAVIVEVESDKRFHTRFIQADSGDGSFYDMGNYYKRDGSVSKISPIMVMGDLHAGEHEEVIFDKTLNLMEELKVTDVFVHDSFSGQSISHYDEKSPHRKALKSLENKNSLVEEINIGVDLFSQILSKISGRIFRVKGNHDEWFERYLSRAGYVDDPINHYDALEYARYYLEGKEPLEMAYKKYMLQEEFDRIVFLNRQSTYRVGDVELAHHGDICLNGSKGSLIGAEKAFGNCVIGHAHSAAVHRTVYRVGTTTKMKLSYTNGPSSWTWTHALVYPNGSRQLITFIPGDEPTFRI